MCFSYFFIPYTLSNYIIIIIIIFFFFFSSSSSYIQSDHNSVTIQILSNMFI